MPQTAGKIAADKADHGAHGEKLLVSGDRLSLRLWKASPSDGGDEPYRAGHESLGYVVSGRARLEIEGQEIRLEPGDSWLVPEGARHRYRIDEPFTAVEATANDGPGG